MSEDINMLGLIPPITLPDHSILSSTFVTSFYDLGKNFENVNSNVTNRKDKKPNDPVTRFHIGNGASMHQINFLADTSENG